MKTKHIQMFDWEKMLKGSKQNIFEGILCFFLFRDLDTIFLENSHQIRLSLLGFNEFWSNVGLILDQSDP